MAYFPAIFSPFTIGSLRLKNRVLMAAMGNNFSHPEGTASDRAIAYYRERARGGAGLIITEACPVSLAGRHRGQSICAHDNSFLPGLRRLVHSIHAAGSRIPLQLHHAGRLADPEISGSPALAPSSIPRAPGLPAPKEMSVEEIQEVIAQFGAAGQRGNPRGLHSSPPALRRKGKEVRQKKIT